MDEYTTESAATPMIERDGKPDRLASNGQPYFTLTHAGVKEEFGHLPFYVTAESSNRAIAERALMVMYDAHLNALKAANVGKMLEWRSRPTITEWPASWPQYHDLKGAMHGEICGMSLGVYSRLAFV